jgi:hypothetical protein
MKREILDKLCSESYDDGALSIIQLIKMEGSKGTKWENVMESLFDLEKSIKSGEYS